MTSTTSYRKAVAERGGRYCQVVLTAAAHAELVRLVELHRLDRREVIERLILGQPLGFQCQHGTRQQQLGMSDPEFKAYVLGGGE